MKNKNEKKDINILKIRKVKRKKNVNANKKKERKMTENIKKQEKSYIFINIFIKKTRNTHRKTISKVNSEER